MPDTMAKKPEKDFIPMNKYLTFAFLIIALACNKDNANSGNADFFSPVPVNISINLSLPAYAALAIPQGHVYEPGGNKGVIVYRTIFNEYVAFDRTCPHNPNEACSYISMDSTSTFYKCGQYNPSFTACCPSVFDPATGNKLSGPATRGLHQYYVKNDGNNLLISNTPF